MMSLFIWKDWFFFSNVKSSQTTTTTTFRSVDHWRLNDLRLNGSNNTWFKSFNCRWKTNHSSCYSSTTTRRWRRIRSSTWPWLFLSVDFLDFVESSITWCLSNLSEKSVRSRTMFDVSSTILSSLWNSFVEHAKTSLSSLSKQTRTIFFLVTKEFLQTISFRLYSHSNHTNRWSFNDAIWC